MSKNCLIDGFSLRGEMEFFNEMEIFTKWSHNIYIYERIY